jgi:two-component system, LuxR family, response regulator FixJ
MSSVASTRLSVQGNGKSASIAALVHVVDDDDGTRNLLEHLVRTVGLASASYASPSLFVDKFDPVRPGCVVLDLRMPESNGMEVLGWLRSQARAVPVLFMSGYGDLATVIRIMKLGAVEFFEKPLNKELLIEAIQHWVRSDIAAWRIWCEHKRMLDRIKTLSSRERQVLECVLDGMSNKETARRLGVSPKAIEVYRGHLMQKMEADNVVKLVRQIAGCLRCGNHSVAPPCLQRARADGLVDWT